MTINYPRIPYNMNMEKTNNQTKYPCQIIIKRLVLFLTLSLTFFLISGSLVFAESNVYRFSGSIAQNDSIYEFSTKYIGDFEATNAYYSFYHADFFDSSGRNLNSIRFQADYYSNERYFVFYASIPPETKKISIYYYDTLLKEFSISRNKPVVSNVRAAQIKTDLYQIIWSAYDADGDKLTFRVYLNGTEEIFFGSVGNSSFLLDTSKVAGGDYKALVEASDGFNVGFKESSLFKVQRKYPEARIYMMNNSVFILGRGIGVAGNVEDPEGEIENITWKLNNQVVGEGREIWLENLSVGRYLLSAEGKDSDGNTAASFVSFSVENSTEPDFSIDRVYPSDSFSIQGAHYITTDFTNIRKENWCNISVYDNGRLIYFDEVYTYANEQRSLDFLLILNSSGKHQIRVRANCENDSLLSNNEISSDFFVEEPRVYVDSCRVLNQAGKIYSMSSGILTKNQSSDCIRISAQNVTLDCGGHSIKSEGNFAAVYSNQPGTKIKNCIISAGAGYNGKGIYLLSANNSYIFNNTLNGNFKSGSSGQWIGIYLLYTSNAVIENNSASGNVMHGIWLESSNYNRIINNSASRNGYTGIYLSSSSSNFLSGNAADNNKFDGMQLNSNSSYNTLSFNRACNNAIGYSQYSDLRCYSSYGNSGQNNTFGSVNCNSSVGYNYCRNSNSMTGYFIYPYYYNYYPYYSNSSQYYYPYYYYPYYYQYYPGYIYP
jgi:parallel beta-helix repeat protein